MSKKLALKDERLDQMQTMARIFQKADRTITGERVKCVIETNPYLSATTPARNDGETITFSKDAIGDLSDIKEVVALSGLNYHELAHLLYTPRSRALKGIQHDSKKWRAFNILEDQRIESMFSSMYPATRAYFTMTAMKHIMKDNHPDKIFPLIWGRRFLGAELRVRLARVYKDQSVVASMKKVIDEFRTLAFPGDIDRGIELTEQFVLLMGNDLTNVDDSDPYGHEYGDPAPNKGRPENNRDQKNAQEFRAAVDEEIEDEDAETEEELAGEGNARPDEKPEQDEEDTDSSEGTDDQDEDDSEEDSDGETGSGDLDADSGEDSDESDSGSASLGGEDDSESDSGNTNEDEDGGNSASMSGPLPKEEVENEVEKLKESMSDTIESIMNDADVIADAEDKQKLVYDGDGRSSVDQLPYAETQGVFDPTPAMRNIAKKAGQQFQRIARDLDPGFHTHQSSGRLNIQRAMRGDAFDTVFDQWDSGKYDAAEMEIVLGGDVSGSMSGFTIELSEAMWTIVQSLSALGNSVSVTSLTWDTNVRLLSGGSTKHDPNKIPFLKAPGGTHPEAFFESAKQIFRNSNKKNKILLMMTDGEWSQPEDMDRIMENLNGAGIVTGLMYFEHPNYGGKTLTPELVEKNFRHKSQIFMRSQTLSDLIPFANGIVKKVMKG